MPRMEAIKDAKWLSVGWALAFAGHITLQKLTHNQNEFMRIVSHDLRSPLTAMPGFANMLELELVGELNEKQKHFVTKIFRNRPDDSISGKHSGCWTI